MKKLFIMAAASVLALTSCSSDKNESTNTPTSVIIPKSSSLILAGSNTSVNVAYTFNGNKIVSSITTNPDASKTTTTYTYTGDLITKASITSTTNSDTDVVEYTYNNNKLATRNETSTVSGTATKTKSTYTYNTDGTVLVNNFNVSSTGTETATGTPSKVTITGGNIVKVETLSTDGTTVTKTTTSEYDSKNHPLKNVLGFDKFLSTGNGSGVNNVTKKTITPTGGTASFGTTTYTYNADGYPTEAKGYTNGTTLTITTSYLY